MIEYFQLSVLGPDGDYLFLPVFDIESESLDFPFVLGELILVFEQFALVLCPDSCLIGKFFVPPRESGQIELVVLELARYLRVRPVESYLQLTDSTLLLIVFIAFEFERGS